jgi:hypothetical protein
VRTDLNRARPGVEALEQRSLMDAGVGVVAGELVLNGTSQGDAFRVTQVDVGGAAVYRVEGLVHDGRLTTFNQGQTAADFAANRLRADLRGGDDLLHVRDVTTRTTIQIGPRRRVSVTPGDVVVKAGAGDDTVRLLNVHADGRFDIDLAGGRDEASAGGIWARQATHVQGGSNDDHYSDLGGNEYGPGGLLLASIVADLAATLNGDPTTATVTPGLGGTFILEYEVSGFSPLFGPVNGAGDNWSGTVRYNLTGDRLTATDGLLEMRASNGDVLVLAFEANFVGANPGPFFGNYQVAGGDGRYAGASGWGVLSGSTTPEGPLADVRFAGTLVVP